MSYRNKVSKGKIQGNRSGFSEWLQQYANMGTDKNGNISSKSIGNGAGFSNTQLAQMQYNHDEAQLDRQFQEDMYNKYQSPEAQMRQYQEAGLNPALMYQGGVDINGPSGGSAASESGAQGGEDPQNGFERAMGIMGQLMQMLTGGANLATQVKSTMNDTAETKATVAEKQAHAANLNEDTESKRLQNGITSAFGMANAYYTNANMKAQLDKIAQDIRESASRIDLNNSYVEVNGEKIEVLKSEKSLNASKEALNNFEVEKGRALLPYSQRLLQAQIYLTTAQGEKTSEEAAQVELDSVAKRNESYAKAAVDMAQAAVSNGLLDEGYCKEFVDYYKKNGAAALVNAYAAYSNSLTNQRNAAVNERNAAVNEKNAETNKQNADSQRMKIILDTVFNTLNLLSKVSISVVPGATGAFGGFAALPAAGAPLLLPPV